MAKTNQKKNMHPAEEDESAGIRTRKVRFTGDGFAFPAAGETKATGKRTSGRDAIIVEGAPGQGNIRNRSENSITELPEAKKSRKKGGQAKKEAVPQTEPHGEKKSGGRRKTDGAAAEKADSHINNNRKKNDKAEKTVRSAEKENVPALTTAAGASDTGRKAKGKKTEATSQQKPAAEKPAAPRRKETNESVPAGAKNKKKKTEKPAAEPAESEALAVLPTEKKPGPAKGKKKKSRLSQKNPDAALEKLAEASPVTIGQNGKPAAEIPPAEIPPAEIPHEKSQNAPAAPKKDRKKGQQNGKNKQSGGKAARDRGTQPADHRNPQKKSAGKGGELLLPCRFSYSGRGFGFAVPLEPENGVGEDIFISPKATMGAMSGDTVTVRVFRHPKPGHSAEGEVEEITERAVRAITGRLTVTRDYAAVKPDNDKLRVLAYVSPEDCAAAGAKNGDKVEILPIGEDYFHRAQSITVHRSRHSRNDPVPYFDTQGKIAVIFGSAAGKEANYAAILHASGIRTEFPPYVKSAAAHAAEQPLTRAGRTDLRDRLIFTIDGADAKDLDDAISLDRREDGSWVLGVHIADVSHYVPYESCVEKEARARGTSVYFTDKVVPMLPEALSNGACSLNAGTDKYALSCEITLTPDGRRTHTVLYKSILRSSVRGVYSEINDLWEKGADSPFAGKYSAVTEVLSHMHELYRILKDQSADRGVMELEGSEAKILLDENGYPIDVQRRERGDAERMIEQFMLQANMGVAETLRAKELPCLYRIHDEPDREKLRAFAVYAHNLGLPTFGLTAMTSDAGGTDADTEGLSDRLMGILAEAHKREIGDIVSSVLLRSMMKAKYVAEPKPHFGLGADTYCHFTSPIRRYPDLFVHTVLTAVLPYTPEGRLSADTPLPPEAFPQMLSQAAPERGVSSTDTEIAAQQAEWKIEDLYMALYMSDKVGQIFDVTVVSVMKFGLFVQCENLVEGLVPAPLFRDAVVNENFCTIRSEGTLYTLGTKMQARLVEADPASGRITFAPLDAAVDA